MGDEAVRVVVAEDHPAYRDGLVRALEEHGGLEVIGTAPDGRRALALIRGKRPHVALLDLEMPDLDGLAVLEKVIAERLPTRVVFVSGFVNATLVLRALEAGASGYVSKDSEASSICEAALKAARGKTAISPDLQARVVDQVRRQRDADAELSGREREILERLAEGETGPVIAAALHLSPETVKTYTRRLYEKLGVTNAAAAVTKAMRQGLLR